MRSKSLSNIQRRIDLPLMKVVLIDGFGTSQNVDLMISANFTNLGILPLDPNKTHLSKISIQARIGDLRVYQ